MESIENEERERQARNDPPSQESVKVKLEFLRHPIVGHESVQEPQSDVGKQQESDDLPAGLKEHLVAGRTDPLARLRDEHPLQSGLDQQEPVAGKDHDVPFITQVSPSNDQSCCTKQFDQFLLKG